jgi:hypothetical protein
MRPHETPLFLWISQGFFSAQDTSDPDAMAEYLKTCVMAPCRLLLDYSVERYKDTLLHQDMMKSISYRFNSCVSFALIKTYKILGHMAPVPSAMAHWSPHLFDLLTSDFKKMEYFRKGSATGTFTSTNIPALVGILVYLESKGLVSFYSSVKKLASRFVKRGSLKLTKGWRTHEEWPQQPNKYTWQSWMPFKVTLALNENIVMDLDQAISLLLYGGIETQVPPGTDVSKFDLAIFREGVNKAIVSLRPAYLVFVLKEGKGKLLAQGEPAGGQEEPVKQTNPLSPYLTQSQVNELANQNGPQEQLDFLTSLQIDLCAKVINVALHRQMLIVEYMKGNSKEKDLDLPAPSEVFETNEGDKKPRGNNLGTLVHLATPKKPGKGKQQTEIPRFFQIVGEHLATRIQTNIRQYHRIEFTKGPEDIWESLRYKPSDLNDSSVESVSAAVPRKAKTTQSSTEEPSTAASLQPRTQNVPPHGDGDKETTRKRSRTSKEHT